jgi:ribulose 1,5-bisphosphate carboxylase large subunit-like protein
MQVAKDLPAKLIAEVIKSKERGETTQDSMVSLISKAIKVLANSTRKNIFLECLESPKEFDRNPLMLYHLRMLEDYGIINYTNKGYLATKFAKDLWDSIDKLTIIPNSTLSIKILLSLKSKPKTFTELKKNLKVNEGSIFRILNFLSSNKLIIKEANYYNLTPLADLSKLDNLVSRYAELIKDASYDDSLESIIIPKEEEIKILDLFEKEKKDYIKKKLWKMEDLIKDHIIVSLSYSSKLEIDDVIKNIIKEQKGVTKSEFVKPLQTLEKNTIKLGYKSDRITSLQKLLNLLSMHWFLDFDAVMIEDVDFPKIFIKNFDGPKFGRNGIRKILDIKNSPLLQTTLLPEENFDIQTFSNLTRRLFISGINEMADHQMLIDNLKNFRKRVEIITELFDEIKDEYGKKIYYFYIYGEDYRDRLDILKEIKSKGTGIGLSPLTLGFPLTSYIIRKYNYPVELHLTLHGTLTRYAKRGISKEGELLPGFGINMNVLLKLFTLAGGDEIHVISPTYSHPVFEGWQTKINCDILNYYFQELKKPFPVLLGGITPINTPSLIKNYGKDIVLKFSTWWLNKAEKLGFSIEKSINAFKQAIEIAVSEEKEITSDKYKDYIESIKFYKKL